MKRDTMLRLIDLAAEYQDIAARCTAEAAQCRQRAADIDRMIALSLGGTAAELVDRSEAMDQAEFRAWLRSQLTAATACRRPYRYPCRG